MNNRRSTIIFWLTTLVLTVAGVAVVYAVKARPHTVPWDECSEVYRQYAHADGIEATFLRGYRVNDTLSIDVTLLQATDSAAWDSIRKDFNISTTYNHITQDAINRGKDVLSLVHTEKANAKTNPLDVTVASKRDRYVCIFHTAKPEQKSLIFDAILDKITNSLKTKQTLIPYEGMSRKV